MDLEYAPLADIVNGFEYARAWRVIRKGQNDWSLIGLNEEAKVVYEVEHLHLAQLEGLLEDVSQDTPVVSIEIPKDMIRKRPIVRILNACLYYLTEGQYGEDGEGRDTTAQSVRDLLKELGVK